MAAVNERLDSLFDIFLNYIAYAAFPLLVVASLICYFYKKKMAAKTLFIIGIIPILSATIFMFIFFCIFSSPPYR